LKRSVSVLLFFCFACFNYLPKTAMKDKEKTGLTSGKT